METKIHFTNLLMLARDTGADRKAIAWVEATNELCTEDDIDSDIALLIKQLPNCRYVPAGFGVKMLIEAYNVGLN